MYETSFEDWQCGSDMELNLTGVDLDIYYSINSSIQVGLFFLIVLPVLILILLCVVALLFAKNINWPIRIVLINIIICSRNLLLVRNHCDTPWISSMNNEENFSCSVAFALFSSNSKFSAMHCSL